MRNIYLLGATGSIGEQALDMMRKQPTDFKLMAVSGYSNLSRLIEIIHEFQPEYVAVKSEDDLEQINSLFPTIKGGFGREGLKELSIYRSSDQEGYLLNALVGMVGLEPTLEAIKINRTVLLANKETLVVGGHLIKEIQKIKQSKIYPIDSEHSAIWQMIQTSKVKDVHRMILTASGGAFRTLERSELSNVNVKDALQHPNWSMGKKITIDSATMMNKGFEMIEACYLFDIDIDRVEAMIHYESKVHALIEFVDGTVLAHLSEPDMHLPIAYAMNYPDRIKDLKVPRFNLLSMNQLTFKPLDGKRYPCLQMAVSAYRIGGSMRTVLNAANEAAVDLFLNEKIHFLEIEEVINDAMQKHQLIDNPSLEEIYQIDASVKADIYQKYR